MNMTASLRPATHGFRPSHWPPPFAAETLITAAATASAAASIIVTVSYESDKQVSESRTDGGREDGRQTARHTATTAAAAGGLRQTRTDEGEQGGAGNRFRPAHAIPPTSHATPSSIQMITFWE